MQIYATAIELWQYNQKFNMAADAILNFDKSEMRRQSYFHDEHQGAGLKPD